MNTEKIEIDLYLQKAQEIDSYIDQMTKSTNFLLVNELQDLYIQKEKYHNLYIEKMKQYEVEL
jgi:hypothetical protein